MCVCVYPSCMDPCRYTKPIIFLNTGIPYIHTMCVACIGHKMNIFTKYDKFQDGVLEAGLMLDAKRCRKYDLSTFSKMRLKIWYLFGRV